MVFVLNEKLLRPKLRLQLEGLLSLSLLSPLSPLLLLPSLAEARRRPSLEVDGGEGDAEATGIYAEVYNKDPEFYAFTRSLNAYRETFSSKGDVLLLDPDSDYFKYLKNGVLQ